MFLRKHLSASALFEQVKAMFAASDAAREPLITVDLACRSAGFAPPQESPEPDGGRPVSLVFFPGGIVRLEVGSDSLVVSAVEFNRIRSALASKPASWGGR